MVDSSDAFRKKNRTCNSVTIELPVGLDGRSVKLRGIGIFQAARGLRDLPGRIANAAPVGNIYSPFCCFRAMVYFTILPPLFMAEPGFSLALHEFRKSLARVPLS
jgi:hypothetical protein